MKRTTRGVPVDAGVDPPGRLSRAWIGIICLAAAVGVATCAALGFLAWSLFFPAEGTLNVLDRAASPQDELSGDYASAADIETAAARYLASYGNSNYFFAPSTGEGNVCLIQEPVMGTGEWAASCGPVPLLKEPVWVTDHFDRDLAIVSDGFDQRELEREGWTSIHPNLLVLSG